MIDYFSWFNLAVPSRLFLLRPRPGRDWQTKRFLLVKLKFGNISAITFGYTFSTCPYKGVGAVLVKKQELITASKVGFSRSSFIKLSSGLLSHKIGSKTHSS